MLCSVTLPLLATQNEGISKEEGLAWLRAAEDCDLEHLKSIVQRTHPTKLLSLFNYQHPATGYTALMEVAASKGYDQQIIEVIEYLFSQLSQNNINQTDYLNKTVDNKDSGSGFLGYDAAMLAAHYENIAMLEQLIAIAKRYQLKLDLNKPAYYGGYNIMMIGIQKGHDKVVESLLKVHKEFNIDLSKKITTGAYKGYNILMLATAKTLDFLYFSIDRNPESYNERTKYIDRLIKSCAVVDHLLNNLEEIECNLNLQLATSTYQGYTALTFLIEAYNLFKAHEKGKVYKTKKVFETS